MPIVIVENPPESFIDPEEVVVKIVVVLSVVGIQLFSDLGLEGLIGKQVVHRVCDLLDVEVNVTLEVLVTNWMHDFISPFAFL